MEWTEGDLVKRVLGKMGGRPVIKGTRIEPEIVLVDEEYGRTHDYLSEFPSARGECTAAQRRTIDARLNKAATDIKRGNVSPGFGSIEAFAAAIQANVKKLKAKTERSAPMK